MDLCSDLAGLNLGYYESVCGCVRARCRVGCRSLLLTADITLCLNWEIGLWDFTAFSLWSFPLLPQPTFIMSCVQMCAFQCYAVAGQTESKASEDNASLLRHAFKQFADFCCLENSSHGSLLEHKEVRWLLQRLSTVTGAVCFSPNVSWLLRNLVG